MELGTEEDKQARKDEHTPKPELKPLSDHLKYAVLDEDENFPVIIPTYLSSDELDHLIHVLKTHKSAIGWYISDLKWVSPSVYMHRILFDDDVKPRVQNQIRLNLIMQEVVTKEVLKLLDVGIIFVISDSSWVSLSQVVPKKRGMIVVKGDSNELIATRLVT